MIDLMNDLESGNEYTADSTRNNVKRQKSKTPNQHRLKAKNTNRHVAGYYSTQNSTRNNNNTSMYPTQTTNSLIDDTSSVVSLGNLDNTFFQIDNAIQEIEKASQSVVKLCAIKKSGLPNQQKDAINRVESITAITTSLIYKVKQMMIDNEKNAKTSDLGPTQIIWFKNMHNAMIKKYQQSIWSFQQSTQEFKDTIQEDFVRQAKIIKPDISQQQIQIMLQAPDPTVYLEQQLMMVDGQMLQEINDLEDEHHKLQKLEKTMLELQEMFNSCAALVANFQEQLDVIEDNVENTKIQVRKAKRELKQGEVYIKQARKVE